MLRIPISMHNVDEADIFRPAAWNAFGMDKEGQDYRACAAYAQCIGISDEGFAAPSSTPLQFRNSRKVS